MRYDSSALPASSSIAPQVLSAVSLVSGSSDCSAAAILARASFMRPSFMSGQPYSTVRSGS